MAKYSGKIGFCVTTNTPEDAPGVWTEKIIERSYRGELLRNYTRNEKSDGVNDNFNIANRISILADPYARENILQAKYATFLGSKWKISSIEVEEHRLILTIGGVYNENES